MNSQNIDSESHTTAGIKCDPCMDGYVRFEVIKPEEFREAMAHNLDDPASRYLTQMVRFAEGMTYDTMPSRLLTSLDERRIIEIVGQDDGKTFHGGSEVFLDGGKMYYAKPSLDGSRLEENPMNLYTCRYCGKEIVARRKPPTICTEESCGRKNTFRATFPTELSSPIWLLPEKPSDTLPIDMFDSLMDYYRDHLVLREREYHVLTAWVMASWLVDDFQTCPYLACIAPMSSGKTQVLEAIRQTAYRAYSLASVTPAAVFRAIEMWHTTLCIDEAEYQIQSNTESGQAIYACLLAGYKRGVGALRTEKRGDDWIPKSYDLFGFKAFSGTKIVLPTLASRSIEFRLKKARPKTDIFTASEGLRLRSRLLWFRYANLGRLRLSYPQTGDGRIRELYAPLFTVAKLLSRELRSNLEAMLEETIVSKKSDDQQSIEAEIVQAISLLSESTSGTLTGERSIVHNSEILAEIGWEPGKSSSIRLGKQLKVLGLQTRHTRQGKVVDIYDADNKTQLEYLYGRYVT